MSKKFRFKNRVALCLAGSVFLGAAGLQGLSVSAMEIPSRFTDTQGHWASDAIDRMSAYQLVNGYNGLFRPSDPITRGEMSIIIDHIMGYQKEATNVFIDLEEAFYTDAVLKAYEADLLIEADGLVRPKDYITREEVAFMVYNAFDIASNQEALSFIDSDQVSYWAKESVDALTAEGIIVGSEGKFNPQSPITRAEAVTILNRLLAGYYNTTGTYTGEVNGKAVINTADANLKDVVIKGDLIIAEGVAEGDVVLENVVVEGRTIIRGGGVNSIKVQGDSTLGDVLMAKEGSAVRLAVSDSSKVNHVTVGKQATDIIVEGTIDKVKVETSDAKLTVQNAHIQELEVAAENARVELKGKTEIKEVAINENAANTKIEVSKDAKVKTANVSAKATINGTGKVSKVNAHANDIVIKTEGTEVKADKGTTGVIAGKEPVKGGTSSNTNKPSHSDSTGGSSSSDSSNNSGPSDNPGSSDSTKPQEKPLSIDKVESVQNGLVRVTLNTATDKALTKDQFSIICTGAGKDMTILEVTTKDNKVYDLKTSYFDDNTYTLGIDLGNGKLIDKDFESKFDCPEITDTEMTRTNANSAEFTFVSDTPGTFYYALGKTDSTQRAFFNEMPTAEALMNEGTKVEMKHQLNNIPITGLTENTPYTLYYVAVDLDNKVTPVKSIQIAEEPVKTPEQGEFTIVSAKGFALPITDDFTEMGGFEIVLNKATSEPLTLENFTIICPKDGKLTLGRVETDDNKTYTVYMKKGSMFNSGNTLTATIEFSEGITAEKKFFVDVWVEGPTEVQLNLTTPSALQVSFKSKEAGKIYYDVTDEDQNNGKPKNPAELFEKGKVQKIQAGYNILEGIEAKTGQWFRFAVEDELGNRLTSYDYYKVPAYVPSTPGETEEKLEVINIQVDNSDWDPALVITLNRPIIIDSLNQKDFKISNVSNLGMLSIDLNNFTPTDTLKITLGNATVNPGAHNLSFKLSYEDKDGTLKEQVFTETFTTN